MRNIGSKLFSLEFYVGMVCERSALRDAEFPMKSWALREG